jgi:hypothetical protein
MCTAVMGEHFSRPQPRNLRCPQVSDPHSVNHCGHTTETQTAEPGRKSITADPPAMKSRSPGDVRQQRRRDRSGAIAGDINTPELGRQRPGIG